MVAELQMLAGVPGIPNEEYHAAPALSKCKLDEFARSPFRFAHRYVYGTLPKPESEAMALGKLIHAMTLEPNTVDDLIAVRPAYIDGRTKAGKDALAEFRTGLGDRQEVTEQTFDLAGTCAKHANEALTRIKAEGKTELSWRTETEHGWLQCRTDIWDQSQNRIYDLKTIGSMDKLESDFWRFGYHLQDAFYRHVIESITGDRPEPMTFVFVETGQPHETAVIQIDQETAEMARIQMFRLLDQYWHCRANNHWPPRFEKVETISAPIWLQRKLEESAKESLVGFQALAAFETREAVT